MLCQEVTHGQEVTVPGQAPWPLLDEQHGTPKRRGSGPGVASAFYTVYETTKQDVMKMSNCHRSLKCLPCCQSGNPNAENPATSVKPSRVDIYWRTAGKNSYWKQMDYPAEGCWVDTKNKCKTEALIEVPMTNFKFCTWWSVCMSRFRRRRHFVSILV